MSNTVIDLTGKWQFKEYPVSARKADDLDQSEWFEAAVPNSVFTNLIEASQINKEDLLSNPENYGWVSEKPWIYRKTFEISAEMLELDRIELNCEGLDTLATIWVNNKQIGKTDNMFIAHRFDVTKMLRAGENSIMIKFDSALEYSNTMRERYKTFKKTDFYMAHRVYIRKAQCQFGWDFCPPLPGCGIWKNIQLEATEKARIDQLQIKTIECSEKSADIKISTEIDAVVKADYKCKLTICDETTSMEYDLTFKAGESSQSALIRIDNPKLWWPTGYGLQNLYHIKAELIYDEKIVDSVEKDFGIRTIKLNRSDDEHGQKFCFEINNQPIYVKGANWVPPSLFAGSVTDETYEKMLKAAKDAQMNILRVWGGGYYESEKFYEICDKEGLLVWQDFMFACACYPEQKWFTDAIKNEAEITIKRLQSHPSLALWCGNNENDWIFFSGWMGNHKKLHGKAIYHKLLPKLLSELDPDRAYIYSTPCGDIKTHNDKDTGCVHQWDIGAFHHPTRDYLYPANQVPRFVTEFGMQALPNIETIKTFCPAENLKISNLAVEKHDYWPDGNERLSRYACELFAPPKNLDEWIYISQLTQARAVRKHVEHLRAYPERNYGVLFWQFADCSPAISWASIDYRQKPKALYYYCKRIYSKTFVAVRSAFAEAISYQIPKLNDLSVIVKNENQNPITATLNCKLMDLKGSTIDSVTSPIILTPFSNSTPLQMPKEMVKPNNPENCCLHMTVESNGSVIAENTFFYMPDKYVNWPKANIEKQLSQTDDTTWQLQLKADVLVKDFCIQTDDDVSLSDNFIDLMPERQTTITIKCAADITELGDKLRFYNLNSLKENSEYTDPN
ncbi:MAG: hypothetical protein KAS96_05740 [Planctomycetes bacterium]|nr:hypothetical protein [Planctomycetota bacterium]